MKKIIGIMAFFLGAGLILSLVFGFIGKIPAGFHPPLPENINFL